MRIDLHLHTNPLSPDSSIDPEAAIREAKKVGLQGLCFTEHNRAWDQEAVERGGLVYRISCSKCHGDGGRGNGNFVLQGDTLRPPSFLASDWRFAEDPVGLRQAIYTGNVAGMPYWGLVGLKYRDIDAVSRYVIDFLRVNYGERR